MNKELLNQAAHAFEEFTSQLDTEAKHSLAPYSEAISATMLHVHLVNDNIVQAEQIIDSLSPEALYDEELVGSVYEYYIRRSRHDRAYDYLLNTKAFFTKIETPIPPSIQYFMDNAETEHLLGGIKQSFTNLLGLQPRNVPRITPDIINNKRNLREFILHEIVCAGKVMMEKIQGIAQIKHENRFNDLILAVLRLRLPIWGWNLSDQPRKGASARGLDAGLVDLLIQAGGNDVALVEALILSGGNYGETKKHVLKCFSYGSNLQQYYLLVYFNGKLGKFDSTWASYQSNVEAIPFDPRYQYDKTLGFQDLSGKFDDVRQFKIAKTTHGSGVEIYHIMMNLSPVLTGPQATKRKATGFKKKPQSPKKKAKPSAKKGSAKKRKTKK